MVESVPKITLTPKEERIFSQLMQIHTESNLKTTLRVAGGWVRDKLLGIESNDIDIALDDMMGADFGQLVVSKMKEKEVKCGLFITKANPAKGKHLETACITLEGESIDLVNLRAPGHTEED
jgi:tRNA nucleotidyltransferase/poly(A) polymerase